MKIANNMKPLDQLKPGDRINVYQNPVTQGHFEGTAILVDHLHVQNGDMEYWSVLFDGEEEAYPRFVMACDKIASAKMIDVKISR